MSQGSSFNFDGQDELESGFEEPINAPDLTESILNRVERERPFLDRKTQKILKISRYVLAGGVLAAFGCVVLVCEFFPGAGQLGRGCSRPVSNVVETTEGQMRLLLASFESFQPVSAEMTVGQTDSLYALDGNSADSQKKKSIGASQEAVKGITFMGPTVDMMDRNGWVMHSLGEVLNGSVDQNTFIPR